MRAAQSKLKVVWLPDNQEFYVTHPNTNVTGFGKTPGAAIRNWLFWWNIPY
jgi:hypothetical protein